MGQGSRGAVFGIYKMMTFKPSMWLYRRIEACESPWEADVGPQLEHWEQETCPGRVQWQKRPGVHQAGEPQGDFPPWKLAGGRNQ